MRVVGIETSRTESLIEEPTPESNDLDMSRIRIRETISPCVGPAPSLNVCIRNSRTNIYVVLQSRSDLPGMAKKRIRETIISPALA